MDATPIELPGEHDLSDDEYSALQQELLAQPDAGDVIKGTGGLRKLRFSDKRRGKGKRGGLRVIYYHWDGRSQFWMFVVYDKDEAIDLSSDERKVLARLLEQEVKARSER
ncbi:toxin [Ralstonia solanacearum]|uniref:toxin n=1 Tax=Ralstonia solanacearum TaxID=305 RepID=UPI001FF8AD5F|nr:toxin [Ralstonia solanacearum]MDB0529665.1 toxin [Ralstonia solanacearum]